MRESTPILSEPQACMLVFLTLTSSFRWPQGARQRRLCLSFALSLAACGQRESPRQADRPVLPIGAVRDAPAEYQLADPACQQNLESHPLTRFTIPTWDGDEVTSRTVVLDDTATKGSLVSAAIGRTIYGEELERDCSGPSTAGRACRDANGREKPWTTVNPGKDLRICRDDYPFGRDTYEGIALTSAYYLARARTRYMQVSRESSAPAPILLSVLPHVVDYYTTKNTQGQSVRIKKYITHNLAYFPDSTLIAVFPEGKRRSESSKGFFWESGFVLAHEYGHHIDFSRHGARYRNGGLHYEPLQHVMVDELAQGEGLGGDTPRSLLGGALAEAFADLLAYYTDGATGRSIVGLPDIGMSRDIGSSYLGNGDSKVLTDERLQVFFREVLVEDVPPTGSRYREIHTIGAILAHAADQLFKRILKAYPEPDGTDVDPINARYLMTLDWMDAVTNALVKMRPEANRQDLTLTITEALEVATNRHLAAFPLSAGPGPSAEDVSDLKRDLCLTSEALLPALAGMPFADSTGSCPR